MAGSCYVRDCGDPACSVCTTTARGFPQPVFKDLGVDKRVTKKAARRDGLFLLEKKG